MNDLSELIDFRMIILIGGLRCRRDALSHVHDKK